MSGPVLYPHETLNGNLHLHLEKVFLDEQPLAAQKIKQVFSIADLGRSGEADWQLASLEWLLKYEPANGSQETADFAAKYGCEIRAWLALDCRPTNLRVSLKLMPTETSGEWKGTLVIARENVSGSAKVQAWLAYDIRNDHIEFKHRVAAETYPWMIYLDPPRSFEREGGLQMHWIDFAKSEEIEWLHDYASAFSAIDMGSEVPRILLNNGIAGLHDLLTDENPGDPIRETLRTMTATNVARGAWMALAHQSLLNFKASGGNLDDWPAPAWQREVMQILALVLGPNQRLKDWLESDGADWVREGLTPANWTRLDVAIGDWLAKRSNLSSNWQKWTKAENIARTANPHADSGTGLIGRLKKRFTTKRDQKSSTNDGQ